MAITADQLPADTVQQIREIFNMFDKEKKESIQVTDLGMALRAAGQNPTEQELLDMMNEVDTDGSGTLDFQEFLIFVTRKMSDYVSEEELKAAFQVFDKDGNGYISAIEMRIMMCTMGDKLSDEEMNELLAEAESDMEGNINYDEFVKKIMPAKDENK
eukprot:TRINITY_DN76989_c0_g1_i1.p1 TRINITY_DN76989_c0_g1~~TRINITY_DN76989_c0_g1_i1.p1  ORF type:complete len:158 (+),score=28.45 TRINITY_DN76989_c0_g1_i1:280-753(+)